MATLFLVIGIVFVLSFIPLLYIVVRGYGRYRGARVVTCPETKEPVGVSVRAGKAALSAAFNEPEFHLASCTRWPERQNCGQECVAQIEDAPDGCLVREKLVEWYADARCAICGKTIAAIRWMDRKPGLLTPEKKTIDWTEIAPETLPVVLETHKPVCFSCRLSESFLSRHPDRVVSDPRPPVSRGSGSRPNAAS